MSLSEHDTLMALNAIPNVGPVTFQKLVAHFGSDPCAILQAKKAELKRVEGVGDQLAEAIISWEKHINLDKEKDKLAQFDGEFITCFNPHYPPLLKEIYDPPIGLYCLGELRPKVRTIGIVGSRRCTLYGQSIAKKFAEGLSHAGFCVASGLARGIDSSAHEGALDGEGSTAAVLGCGGDIIYPPENRDLYQQVRQKGVVMTEYPFGRKADKTTFPRRNRIVAGMVQGVIVVETNSNGGSMITARLANEQGRQVFAIPGRIDQASSKGCHELIRDGVTLVTCVEEVLEELKYMGQMEIAFGDTTQPEIPDNLSEDEAKVLKHMRESGIIGLESIAEALAVPVQSISSTLMMLELKHHIVKRADGNFEAA